MARLFSRGKGNVLFFGQWIRYNTAKSNAQETGDAHGTAYLDGPGRLVLETMEKRRGQRQQLLLVPEHASHEAELDLCRACGSTASRDAEVLSFRNLATRVLGQVGGLADVTLDNGGKLLTLQRALLETAPQMTVYRKPSQKVGFLEQMLALFDELRSYEVTPEILYQQAQDIDGSTHDKLTDLSLLYAAYEARLRRPGLDARDRMTKLCDHLEESGYVRGKDIFIDGFTYFNAQERRALAVFLRQARSVTVTLLGEVNSREEIFEPTLKTMSMLERLAASEGKPVKLLSLTNEDPSALGHLERHFFGENLPYEGDSTVIRLREAATVYSEVEQTAADIRRLLAAGKCRCRDITVAARNMTEYAGTIETVFERYGIPVYLSRRSDILEKPVLTMLLSAVDAVTGGIQNESQMTLRINGDSVLTIYTITGENRDNRSRMGSRIVLRRQATTVYAGEVYEIAPYYGMDEDLLRRCFSLILGTWNNS